MPDELLLGADLGTSGLKLVALDLGGRVVAEAERGYPIDGPAPTARRPPSASGGTLSTRRWRRWRRRWPGAGSAPSASSGQMHGAVLVDAAGQALRPALLWADCRATAELDLWRSLPAADRAALANPLAPGMTGPMLAWVARHEPRMLARRPPSCCPRTRSGRRSCLVSRRSPIAATPRRPCCGT